MTSTAANSQVSTRRFAFIPRWRSGAVAPYALFSPALLLLLVFNVRSIGGR